jgi:hypothetical protein
MLIGVFQIYLVDLPWRFRKYFQRQEKYRQSKFMFPLAALEIVMHKPSQYC